MNLGHLCWYRYVSFADITYKSIISIIIELASTANGIMSTTTINCCKVHHQLQLRPQTKLTRLHRLYSVLWKPMLCFCRKHGNLLTTNPAEILRQHTSYVHHHPACPVKEDHRIDHSRLCIHPHRQSSALRNGKSMGRSCPPLPHPVLHWESRVVVGPIRHCRLRFA